jgi:hypothetical protein
MAIPGSGAISMSMFNTELGRTSNTANSSLAGGSTPAVGSLFWLANQSGSLNQTSPHAMSEWYGYSAGIIVDITLCDFISANGVGGVTVSATTNVNVDTTVTINWTWTGDLSSVLYGITTISSGTSSGTSTEFGAVGDENFANLSTSVSPTSYGNQTYDANSPSYYSCY